MRERESLYSRIRRYDLW